MTSQKKNEQLLRQGLTEMEVIDRLKDDFSIAFMCRVMGISRQAFYASQERVESQHAQQDRFLLKVVREVFHESRDTYGSPRIHEGLKARGIKVSQKRVARLMVTNGLHGRIRKRSFKPALQSKETMPAPNLLNREFKPDGKNQSWASDITYMWTNEGWLFLCVVIDLFSRKVVGWSMATRQGSALVSKALNMVLQQRGRPSKLLHHSDQGCQYTSADFRGLLRENGIRCSMSRRGNCWDNACVESFFGTLKQELFYGRRWTTADELRTAVFDYIEVFYNRTRMHSTLGFVSPEKFEQDAMSERVNQIG